MNRRFVLVLALTPLLAACAPFFAQAPVARTAAGAGLGAREAAPIAAVSVQEAYRLTQGDASLKFYDVREPDEYAGGHAPGTVNKPLSAIATWSASESPKARYVLICRSGNRSGQAARYLAERGFQTLTNVEGGMLEWVKHPELPVVK